MSIADECSKDTSPAQNDSQTCGSAEHTTLEQLTCLPADSPARTSAMPAAARGLTGSGRDSGQNTCESFASYDRDLCLWRTYQLCFTWDSGEFSESWPRAGMTRSGIAYRLSPLVPRISVTEFGYWPTPCSAMEAPNLGSNKVNGPTSLAQVARQMWPTPVANDDNKSVEAHLAMKARMNGGPRCAITSLNVAVKAAERGMWPTPQAHDAQKGYAERVGRFGTEHGGRNLNDWVQQWPTPTANRRSGLQSHGKNAITGQLNPTWVEWLMGFPLEWTDLKDLATPLSRKSRSGSRIGSKP
jgi:hypothetical protein